MVHSPAYSNLLCAGDPILDIYINEDGLMHHFNGGALNIYQNILALLEMNYSEFDDYRVYPNNIKFAYPKDFRHANIFNCYSIIRTPLHKEGIPIVSKDIKEIFYSPEDIAMDIYNCRPSILVLGDYNKGTLSSSYNEDLPNIEYAIVDSRYRSLDLSWIETCKTKIWHATNTEYDKDWAKNFDIVFWTAGSDPVKILRDGELVAELEVPSETKIKNTCGSGDTFTATIATCLFIYGEADNKALIEYAKYAIKVCQDVITRPYTAVTSKRIKEECLLRT